MAASDRPTFDAGTAERVLDEYRSTFPEVEKLFRVHVGEASGAELGLKTITTALRNLNHTVCLVVNRDKGTEYLFAREREDEREWFSVTEYPHRTLGPLPVYEHNVLDRTSQYPVKAEKFERSPFADVELPEHDLDEDEVELDV